MEWCDLIYNSMYRVLKETQDLIYDLCKSKVSIINEKISVDSDSVTWKIKVKK